MKDNIGLLIFCINKDKNKKYYKRLFNQKETIEDSFGNPLEWEELPENKMCRIKYQLNDVNLFDKADWEKMSQFLVKYLPNFEAALKPEIARMK